MIACAKSESTADNIPTITLVKVNGSSDSVHELMAGDTLNMTVKAIDDDGVSQIKIDIHGANDGHHHGKMATIDWTYVVVKNTYGNDVTLNEQTVIPADAKSGYYHMIFRAIDTYGNESAFVEQDLILHSASEPNIVFTAPNWSSIPVYNSGDTISLAGSITDDDGIAEIVYRVIREIDNTEILQGDMDFTATTSADISSFPGKLILPLGMSMGGYHFHLQVLDEEGNLATFEGEFVIQ